MMPLLGLCIALMTVGGPQRGEALDPRQTWAVVSGVLEWKDPGLASFPKQNRKDQELFELLGSNGVPIAQRRLLIDDAATTDAILDALKDAVARAPRGSTLVFYYAGHGFKDDQGRIVFASSDASTTRGKKAGLYLDDLAPILADFKGERIVLLADCCFSGGLLAVAEALAKDERVVALTSAESSNISTGNWTFTQAIIDGLTGKAVGDRDRDGSVELGELAQEVADAMKYREQQRYAFATHGVSRDLVLKKAVRDGEKVDRRDYVQAKDPDDGRLHPARVLTVKGDRMHVAFYDYSDEQRAWVSTAETAPIEFRTWPVGTKMFIDWKGVPYATEVIAVDDGFMKVTYPGWDASWDEWITATRVRDAGAAVASGAKGLEVEWEGKWYPAVKTGMKGELTCIHYVGYEDSWDECVEPARVR